MKSLTFRVADPGDEALYLSWANHPDVRKNSFNQDTILPENHHRWFQKKIQEKDALLLVFLNEEEKAVGQVRIDRGEHLQVDISVDASFRGKGYAAPMLQLTLDEYRKRFGKGQQVYSHIKKANISSLKTFEKIGFKKSESADHPDYFTYIFTL